MKTNNNVLRVLRVENIGRKTITVETQLEASMVIDNKNQTVLIKLTLSPKELITNCGEPMKSVRDKIISGLKESFPSADSKPCFGAYYSTLYNNTELPNHINVEHIKEEQIGSLKERLGQLVEEVMTQDFSIV